MQLLPAGSRLCAPDRGAQCRAWERGPEGGAGGTSKMKLEVFLGIMFCLLVSFSSCHVTAAPEDREEYRDAVVDLFDALGKNQERIMQQKWENTTSAAPQTVERKAGPASPPLKLGLSICAMKADRGPCRARHSRYHFNIQTRQCEFFEYGGCEGNENNFLTVEECQATCIVPDLPEKIKRTRFKKEKPSFCLLENDPGICRGLISRYFYNKESQQCEKFLYGGCLGNQNNFESMKECQDVCQDSPNSLQMENEKDLPGMSNNSYPAIKEVLGLALIPSFCMTPMDRGLCRANEKRFFYNHTTGKCHPFSYSGCGGNVNNFTSRKSCLRMCKKGFIKKRRGQQGIMKARRRRKKQPAKLTVEEIVIERM